MVQKILLQIEIDDANLDAAQAKADKFEFTLKKLQERLDMLAGVDPKAPENEARRKLIRWLDGLDKIVSQAKEKPPEGGKTCERTPPDPELLRKATAMIAAHEAMTHEQTD